jgi:hypothetical protein
MPVRPFSDAQTLQSLRDSDFDSLSAMGEVLDNSIQADATSIRVQFNVRNKKEIESVTFMDDGHGMSEQTIQNCLRLGWSSRFNDRSGIGRFGVGMTLGAIHECKRIEVYSKTDGSDWFFTYLDLDEIERSDSSGEEWQIPTPTRAKPVLNNGLEKHLPSKSGTVVIWKKYDRLMDPPKDLIDNFRVWMGRTYRYFLWNEPVNGHEILRSTPVSIYLDGQEVHAIDPLYVRKTKTEFPDDPVAHEYSPVSFDWPILDPEISLALGFSSSIIRIRLSLLPQEWRVYQGAGESAESKKRHVPLNEGISFVRQGREVGYDWIPYFKFQSEQRDRFWGMEIHFEPCLDRSFTVKNIKRGAVPSPELKQAIADKVAPWIKKQRELISDHWKKVQSDSGKSAALPSGGGAHTPAEKIAAVAKVPKGRLAAEKDSAEEMKRVANELSPGNGEEKARWLAKFASQPFSIGELGWAGQTFVDIHFMGGSDALVYNTRHTFFETLKTIKSEIADGVNLEFNAERLTTLIDMLLISYAKAESMLDANDKLNAVDLIDHLKSYWGQYLKTYITTWQEEFDASLKYGR